MPVPLLAAGALAAMAAGADACVGGDDCCGGDHQNEAVVAAVDHHDDDDDDLEKNAGAAAEQRDDREREKSVRFSNTGNNNNNNSSLPGTNNQKNMVLNESLATLSTLNSQQQQQSQPRSIRSIESPFFPATKQTSSTNTSSRSSLGVPLHQQRHRPKSPTTLSQQQQQQHALKFTGGFIDGDFNSGKIHDIQLPQHCHVMAYHEPWLVVGLNQGIAFYYYSQETTSSCNSLYTPQHVCTCPFSAMVSAIVWIAEDEEESSTSSSTSLPSHLLAAAGLDGSVCLYEIDMDILEAQGPVMLYQFQVGQHHPQVRALATTWYGKLHPTLVMAVGDKSGALTLASFQYRSSSSSSSSSSSINATMLLQQIGIEVAKTFPAGILGMALQDGLLACSTKDGQVVVHQLTRNYTGMVQLQSVVWSCQRDGPVRCVTMTNSNNKKNMLAFGGYDKTLVLVDTQQWAISREIPLQGTINTIVLQDPRYIVVGCRDKTLTLFDTSTFHPVKTFHTAGWVTSVCWSTSRRQMTEHQKDSLVVRTHPTCISILDLTPIQQTDIFLPSRHGDSVSVSWSPDGQFLARTVGTCIVVTDVTTSTASRSSYNFHDGVASISLRQTVFRVAFSPRHEDDAYDLAAIDESGHLSVFCLSSSSTTHLQLVQETFVSEHLKCLAWSSDGSLLATGGKNKLLHVFEKAENGLKSKIEPVVLGGRVWDVHFRPPMTPISSFQVAVALGDYTTVLLNEKFEPSLQVPRSRTCRCVAFHPTEPLLATGDGANLVAIVDMIEEEVTHEIDAGGRVNTISFSPVGDFLIVGSDDSCFRLYETSTYLCVQEVPSEGFALTASFSPNGHYLALGGASESYSIIRLGPFLSLDLIPLTSKDGIENILPNWALTEALYRSGDGPSFLQRHMLAGGAENLRRVAATLRDHPTSIHTFNRSTSEGFFETVLALKRPNLLKLAVSVLVDGTLDMEGESNLLTTDLPDRGKEILVDITSNYPPEFVVETLRTMVFVKVPFADQRYVEEDQRLERGSSSYTDPWPKSMIKGRHLERNDKFSKELDIRGGMSRTPAVLPLPGLGAMDFLASLLTNAPADVFDNNAMALVLKILWKYHIKFFFCLDFVVFLTHYCSWIALVELVASSGPPVKFQLGSSETILGLAVSALNTIFASKEVAQSRVGRRGVYWRSLWNYFDILAVCCIYVYVADILFAIFPGDGHIPLGVLTTIILTVKLLSYLRGFGDTGWLISVLIANFHDVRGFLIILFSILMGFAVSFRSIFADTGDDGFASLRRSFLSTFELTITGSYDPMLLFEAKYTVLAVVLFILAITCVLVVALNALISILADSFAKVQENAVANRRKEQAALIVEYMMLLPPWKRRKIEWDTKWFHTLLEVDADGDLLVQTNDWEGGLNALRRDVERLSESNTQNTQRALQTMKDEVEGEIQKLKRELVSLLDDVSDDVKHLRKKQAEVGGIKFSGKNVARAVKAVRSVGKQGKALLEGKHN